MTIAESREKCKSLIASVPRDVLILTILILASSASFGLGYLAGFDAGQGSDLSLALPSFVASSTEGNIVASKGGTKYYLPGCAGADRISDANKIWFVSTEAALSAGYTLAANCRGI